MTSYQQQLMIKAVRGYSRRPIQARSSFQILSQLGETGYEAAFFGLGFCYHMGLGVEYTPGLAWYWYSKAYACTRCPNAAGGMGMCLLYGIGVRRDDWRATKLVAESVAGGSGYGYAVRGMCSQYGVGDYSVDEDAALLWYARAGACSNLVGSGYAAAIMIRRAGTAAEQLKCLETLHLAAEMQVAEALHALGDVYREGTLVAVDVGRSEACYRRAALRGCYRSQERLCWQTWTTQASTHEYVVACVAVLAGSSHPERAVRLPQLCQWLSLNPGLDTHQRAYWKQQAAFHECADARACQLTVVDPSRG